MGVIIKQSSWALVANYVGVLLGFLNVMIIMPAVLQPDQIGLVNLILSSAFIIYPFMDFSASQLLNRYFTQVQSPQQMMNVSILVYLTGILVFFLVFLFGKPLFIAYYQENSPEIIPYFWFVFALAVVLGWQVILETYNTIFKHLHINVFVKEVIFRLLITLSITLYALKQIPFETYIHLHFGMYVMVVLILFFFIIGKGHFSLQLSLPDFNKEQVKEMGKYGSFVLFTGMASVLAVRIDTLMLGSLKGLTEVGVYTIAMFMTALIDIPRRMILQSSFPVIRSSVHLNDWDNIKNIQQKSILNLVLICSIMFMMIMINVEDIYQIIPKGSLYKDGAWVVLFLGLARLVEVSNGVNNEIFQASKHYKYILIFFVLMAFSTISLNYVFIPDYGYKGAAFATLLASVINTIVKVIAFKKVFRIPSYSWKIASILLVISIIGICCYLLPLPFNSLFNLPIRSAVAGLLLLAYIHYSRISPELNGIIEQIFSFVLKKLR